MIASELFGMGVSPLEKLVRTVVVYGGLAVLLRLGGKREMAQLNTFDLVVILLLSNVVQNAVIGNDTSLSGGLLGAATLVAVNAVVVRVARFSAGFARLFEGMPTRLVYHGQVDDRALRRLGIRRADLQIALRRQGAEDLSQVDQAVLDPGGMILVEQYEPDHAATKGDLLALEQRLLAALRQQPE